MVLPELSNNKSGISLKERNPSEKRLKLLSKELEDATNEFLEKMARLEKLLAQVNE